MSMLIKAQGEYSPIATIYQKQFGTYFPANGIYVKIDGEYTSQGYSWNDGPIIDAIIPIGSSTTLYALVTGGNYGNQVQIVRQRFCEMSMDLPVVSSGFSLDGGNTQTGRNSIDSALSNINAAGIAAKGIKLGFPINLGNNDIVGYRYSNTTYSYPEGSVTDNSIANTVNSWPVATQEKKNLMIQNLTYIVNAIYASGHEPMLGTVNPRGGRAVFEAFREWNDNLYKPLIQQLCPQWVNTDGDPVYDMEDLYWKWVPSTYTDAEWYDSDGTHPSPIAMDKIQRYLAQSWGRYARAPRLTNQTRSIIFVFSNTFIHDRGGINQLITNPSPFVRENNQFDLIDRRGNVKLGSSINLFSPSNAIIYYGGADKGNLGDYTISLNSRYVQGSLTYSYSPLTLVYSEGVQSAGKTGIVKISASSNVNSTWRFGYEVQGVSKYINPTLPGPQIVEFTATLDASGSVTVNLLRQAGAWGISGAEFIFD